MLNHLFPITKSDTDVVPAHSAIYVGGTGTLVVVSRIPDGQGGFTEATTTLTAVVAGVFHPISVHKIMAASTATDIVGAR